MKLAAVLYRRHHFFVMQFNIETETETEIESDGRWIAEVLEVPGALAYGLTREEAIQRSESLALRVLAEPGM